MFHRETDLMYFRSMKVSLDKLFINTAEPIPVEQWHAQDVTDNPDLVSHELRYVTLSIDISTNSIQRLISGLQPNMPWAEDQFQERVSGEPLNPPPSEAWWPYAQQGNAAHKEGEVFSHSYPERYWPKHAGTLGCGGDPGGCEIDREDGHFGIR